MSRYFSANSMQLLAWEVLRRPSTTDTLGAAAPCRLLGRAAARDGPSSSPVTQGAPRAPRAPGVQEHRAQEPEHSLGTTGRAELWSLCPCCPWAAAPLHQLQLLSAAQGGNKVSLLLNKSCSVGTLWLGFVVLLLPNTCIYSDTSAKESSFVICVSVVRHHPQEGIQCKLPGNAAPTLCFGVFTPCTPRVSK